MTYNVNIIAGCHCPTLRQVSDALGRINAESTSPRRWLTEKDIRDGDFVIDSDRDYPVDYYSVLPAFFTGTRGILRGGEFYKRAAVQTGEIARAFSDGVVKIHFLIEPTLTHLNRHFNSLLPEVQSSLRKGLIGAPSWVPVLLAMRDNISNGSITVWNLRSVLKWRSALLMAICGDFIDENHAVRIDYKNLSAKNFPYDSARDIAQFELDLDVIDSLPELNLIE